MTLADHESPVILSKNDLSVSLLSNESRDVEIINTRSAHHRPWEVIGRPWLHNVAAARESPLSQRQTLLMWLLCQNL
jgi:hypothetical protein